MKKQEFLNWAKAFATTICAEFADLTRDLSKFDPKMAELHRNMRLAQIALRDYAKSRIEAGK